MKRTAIVAILALFGGAAGFAATQLAPVQTTGSELNPVSGSNGSNTKPTDYTARRKTATKSGDFEALHEGLQISDYLRSKILSQGGSSIAVLVPFEMTRDEATAQAHRFRLKVTEEGYSAVMRDHSRDIVVGGTAGDSAGSDYIGRFESFDPGRGGSVPFGFRGADYLVDMYCLPQKENCVDAVQLEAFVMSLTSGLLVR